MLRSAGAMEKGRRLQKKMGFSEAIFKVVDVRDCPYYKKGDVGRAIAHWQKVVELRPDSKYAKKAIDRIQKVQGA